MRPEEEIVKRIKESGLKASAVARETGLSKQYLHKITSGEVRALQPETRDKLLAALDKLAAAASGTTPMKTVHPGLEELAASKDLMQSLGFTPELIEAARGIYSPGPDGQPLVIDTLSEAVEIVQALQRQWQRRRDRA